MSPAAPQDPEPEPEPELPDELEDALADVLLRAASSREERLAALIAEHPAHEPALRSRIAELSGAEAAAQGDAARGNAPSGSGPPFERIGPYELLEVLGRGGMGTVYLAQQLEPIRRQVAVKVIPGGSREILARFELERQALAVMAHPSIAKVFDAGISPSGQPYFVMEYVPGSPLTDYCDAHRLTIAERIAVFQQVCRGVQHAHRRGVLHRDLKPGNILVTDGEGRPAVKIIDFGLARAVDERLAGESIHTMHGQLLGTPEYMSPEQAAGEVQRIDTRTDIYSLGVLLYELLSGELPLSTAELRTGSSGEIQRRILAADPPNPSTKVSSVAEEGSAPPARGLSRASLHRRLKGDLDWIVMRAMAREPERRYESALDLALDLDRFLADEPVLAGPPSTAYRVQKFVRRYRGRVVAAALLLASLIAGLIGTAIGLGEARAQQARAEGALRSIHEISRWFIVDFHDQIDDVPGTMEARRQLVAQGLSYLAELARQRADDPDLAFDIARGYLRVGTIQGWPHRPNIGDRAGALASFAEALALLDRVEREGRGGPAVDGVRMEVQLRIVDVHTEALEEGQALAALEDARGLLDRFAGPEERRRREFDVALRRALLLRRTADSRAALASYHAAEELLVSEADDEVTDAHLGSVGSLYHGLGSLYSDEFGDDPRWEPERALEYFGKALEAYEALAQRDPGSGFSLQSVVTTRQAMASVLRRTGEHDRAARAFEQNISAIERLLTMDPGSIWGPDQLALSAQELGRTRRDMGELEASVVAFEETLSAYERLRQLRPDDPRELRRHATTLEMLGGVHARRGDVAALRAAYADAIEMWRVVEEAPLDAGEEHVSLEARNRLVGHLMQLEAAEELLEELRALDAGLQERVAGGAAPDLRDGARRTRVLVGLTLLELAEDDEVDSTAVTRLREASAILREAAASYDESGESDEVSAGLPGMIQQAEDLLQRRAL